MFTLPVICRSVESRTVAQPKAKPRCFFPNDAEQQVERDEHNNAECAILCVALLFDYASVQLNLF